MNKTLEKTYESSIRMKINNHSGTSTEERYSRKINYSRLITKPVLKNYSEDKELDILLACEPYAGDNYTLYDEIVRLVERNNFQIYSPHRDRKEDKINFILNEAIPRTKGVLIHLNPLTNCVKQSLISTIKNNKPFIILYNDELSLDKNLFDKIKSNPNFINEVKYYSEENAIKLLEIHIWGLLKNERL